MQQEDLTENGLDVMEEGAEQIETDETRESGEQEDEQEIESVRENSEEETEDGVSEGSEESLEQTTTIEVSVDSVSMDTSLASLGFVPVALFCIIFLLGIIALGGD